MKIENIYELNEFLKIDTKFKELKTSKDFTSVQIRHINDIDSLEYLIKQFSLVFNKKFVLNSRRAHLLMIEYSLYNFEQLLENSIELRTIEQQAGLCTAISKVNNFNVEEVLQKGPKNKLVIFMTRPQRDRVVELKLKIGARSEGVVVLICVIMAMNASFSERDFRFDKNEDEMDICKEYWQNGEGGVNFKIRKYIQDFENKLIKHVYDLYVYLKIELEHSKQDIKSTLNRIRFDCVEKLLKRIEEKGFDKCP
jgi:hypothetical protein